MRFGTAKHSMVVGIVALLCIPLRASATEFAAAKSYPVGTNPSGVVVADFNGDGKPDIAVVNSGSNNVSILLGNGDGTFQAAKNFDAGNSMSAIFAGDFNGDGKQDLALFLPGSTTNSTNGEVRILLGNGDGTFQAAVATTLTVTAWTLNVGDFNGDEKADLVLSNFDQSIPQFTLQLFLGKGDGTFQAAKQIPAADLNGPAFAVADFNKDGKLDLAITTAGGVQALLGNGDGTFRPAATVTTDPGFPDGVTGILTADLNGDGHADLIVNLSRGRTVCTPTCHNEFIFNIEVFLGQGDGTFGDGLESPTLNLGSAEAAFGDFNGDGRTDLISDLYGILLSRADGTFAPPIALSTQGNGVARDLNADKLDDLVFLDSKNNAILVLLNATPTAGADLAILTAGPFRALSGPDPVGIGKALTYGADVLNEGPGAATSVTFTDTLPSSVTFVSATSTAGSCVESHLVVTCSAGPLADADDFQVSIVVTPTATGTITNTMDVSAAEPDLALANNSATLVDTVLPVYTLTVTKSGSGSGTLDVSQLAGGPTFTCDSTCSSTFVSGTKLALIASADLSSFFQGWGGACTGTFTPCRLTMTADMSVTATFVLDPKLSVTFAGGGAGTVTSSDNSLNCSNTAGACSSFYQPGTSISLSAAPSGGSKFASWSGACTGTDPNTCTVTLNSDQSVTATFNPPPDFSLSPTASSLTTTAGGQVTDVISISEQGGFSAAIQLSCAVAGPAPLPSCSLSPNSIPPGANSPSSMLTVAPGKLASLPSPLLRGGPVFASLLPLGLLGCILATQSGEQRKRWALCVTLLVLAILHAACGGGSNTPPASQNYSVTVTAVSGAVQHSTKISVTVN